MKQVLCLALFMMSILFTSCATNTLGNNGNNLGIDSGLFTGKPCKLPCWNGLTPSVSTFNDVDQFMQGLSIKQWPAKEVDTSVYEPGCRIVGIADRPGHEVNALILMNVENGKLTYILSTHDNMPSLQQIVDHLGPPEYFKALDVIGPDGEV